MRALLAMLCLAAAPAMAQEAAGAVAGPQLTLDDALRAAKEHQPQLVQAQAAVESARARSDQARAALLPQVSATASYQRAPTARNNARRKPGKHTQRHNRQQFNSQSHGL